MISSSYKQALTHNENLNKVKAFTYSSEAKCNNFLDLDCADMNGFFFSTYLQFSTINRC